MEQIISERLSALVVAALCSKKGWMSYRHPSSSPSAFPFAFTVHPKDTDTFRALRTRCFLPAWFTQVDYSEAYTLFLMGKRHLHGGCLEAKENREMPVGRADVLTLLSASSTERWRGWSGDGMVLLEEDVKQPRTWPNTPPLSCAKAATEGKYWACSGWLNVPFIPYLMWCGRQRRCDGINTNPPPSLAFPSIHIYIKKAVNYNDWKSLLK